MWQIQLSICEVPKFQPQQAVIVMTSKSGFNNRRATHTKLGFFLMIFDFPEKIIFSSFQFQLLYCSLDWPFEVS